MKNFICITNNSPEIRSKLESLGFHICICATFPSAAWLHFYYRKGPTVEQSCKEFHGVGASCENECKGACKEMCIKCSVLEALSCKEDIHLFNDINTCVNFINSLKYD